jgi:AhpD family alkylhydroperoxidase
MSAPTKDASTADVPVNPAPPRLAIGKLAPAAYRAQVALSAASQEGGISHTILELVKTRVSQINGCAFCLDMHTIDARAYGETEQRLHALAAWREAPFYTARERAALGLAEGLTRLAIEPLDDAAYDEAAEHFDERELAHLIWAITVINGWNRVALASRLEAGHHTPPKVD